MLSKSTFIIVFDEDSLHYIVMWHYLYNTVHIAKKQYFKAMAPGPCRFALLFELFSNVSSQNLDTSDFSPACLCFPRIQKYGISGARWIPKNRLKLSGLKEEVMASFSNVK